LKNNLTRQAPICNVRLCYRFKVGCDDAHHTMPTATMPMVNMLRADPLAQPQITPPLQRLSGRIERKA
jgi:hypothetical protein